MSIPPSGASPTCASTGLGIPECSCRRCLLDQLQRHAPKEVWRRAALLLAEPDATGAPPEAGAEMPQSAAG